MPPVPSDGVGLCEELSEVYKNLREGDELKRMIDEMSDILMENWMSGNKIQKNRIPKYYMTKHDVKNLYRYQLRGGFRGIYTILVEGDQTFSWILDVLDHGEYERRFGY